MGVKTYLELGCGSAGHMRLEGVSSIAIDIAEHTGCIDHIMGNSHDPAMVDKILAHLKGEPDAIFIDASHEYEDARADFDLWWPHARLLVGFHDIKMPGPERLWEELAPHHGSVQIIARDIASAEAWQRSPYPDGRMNIGGIGVLFKERP